MNRTVRGLALFAIGVGAWACKGDPQSSLDRGAISSVNADPARILVDAGATTPVLIDARDQLNQAVEITSVSEVAGTGITFARDYLFQPVFDAGATDSVACRAINNSEWTGAGCLVPRTNPTKLRYEITGTALAETSFDVTINGSSTVSIPVTVTVPTTITGALSNTAPVFDEDVTLTLPAGALFDPAVVVDPALWQIVTVGPNSALVTDLTATVVTFQFAPNIEGPVSAGPVVLPANPAVPGLTVTTSEIFTSPQVQLPLQVTLSSSSITGFDLMTVTAGTGLIFSQPSLLFIADSGVGCPIDPSCRAATIINRAADGSTIDATWPQDRTGSVYVTLMAAAGAPQFPTLNGETDQTLTVAPTTFNATAANLGSPNGIGLEVIRLTIFDPTLSLAPTAQVTSISGGAVSWTLSVDPGGTWIEYVPSGSGTPTVDGIIAGGLVFEFPIANSVTAASSLPGTDRESTAPTITLPAPGNTLMFYDGPGFLGTSFGAPASFYNITTVAGTVSVDYVVTWDPLAVDDLGMYDNNGAWDFCAADAFGPQPGGPEANTCTGPGGAPIGAATVAHDLESFFPFWPASATTYQPGVFLQSYTVN